MLFETWVYLWIRVCVLFTCARRALKDSFSREMLFSTTSSLTSLSLCWTCSSWVRTSSDSSAESWAWTTSRHACVECSHKQLNCPVINSLRTACVLPCVCSCPTLVFEVSTLAPQYWWCPAGGAPFPQASSPPAAVHPPNKWAQLHWVNKQADAQKRKW